MAGLAVVMPFEWPWSCVSVFSDIPVHLLAYNLLVSYAQGLAGASQEDESR